MYTSNAQWPEGTVSTPTGDGITTDTHSSFDAAFYVCEALKENGLGGELEIFPVRVWVDKEDK